VLYAAINGHLDDVARNQIGSFEKEFVGYAEKMNAEILETIRKEGDISAETEEKLKKMITEFKDVFSESK